MTDAILGHDCEGRELRAGDRVEIVDVPASHEHLRGQHHTVIGACPCWFGAVDIDIPASSLYWKWTSAWPSQLRLINSGRELFDKCAHEADKMPSESTIRRAMPWTQPEES